MRRARSRRCATRTCPLPPFRECSSRWEKARWCRASLPNERTLSAIEGVLGARVHLSLPDPDPLREGPRPKATASVLLKHRGTTPPIDAHEVKRLVAGAAPGLLPDDVAVVMVPRPAPSGSGDRSLSRLGPISATRGSVGLLRIIAAGVLLV